MKIEFFVAHKPAPGGSKTAMRNPTTGRMFYKDACVRNPEWRAAVRYAAQQAYSGTPTREPVMVTVFFHLNRPKSHYGTGRNAGVLKATAPAHPTAKPDLTKLWRSTEDALTGVLWHDDSQIYNQMICKMFNSGENATEGCQIYANWGEPENDGGCSCEFDLMDEHERPGPRCPNHAAPGSTPVEIIGLERSECPPER